VSAKESKSPISRGRGGILVHFSDRNKRCTIFAEGEVLRQPAAGGVTHEKGINVLRVAGSLAEFEWDQRLGH
jgi:hypothetical protein